MPHYPQGMIIFCLYLYFKCLSLTLSLSSRLLSISYESSTRLQQPLQKGPAPSLSYYKYRFHRTHLHYLLTHPAHDNKHVPLSLFRSYELYYNIHLFYSPYTYSYLSVRILYFAGPPQLAISYLYMLKGTHQHVKSSTIT